MIARKKVIKGRTEETSKATIANEYETESPDSSNYVDLKFSKAAIVYSRYASNKNLKIGLKRNIFFSLILTLWNLGNLLKTITIIPNNTVSKAMIIKLRKIEPKLGTKLLDPYPISSKLTFSGKLSLNVK